MGLYLCLKSPQPTRGIQIPSLWAVIQSLTKYRNSRCRQERIQTFAAARTRQPKVDGDNRGGGELRTQEGMYGV